MPNWSILNVVARMLATCWLYLLVSTLHDNRTKFRTQESSSLRWQKASTKADLSICSLVPHVGRLVSARGRLPDATRGSDQRPERLFHKIGHPSGLCLDCLDGTSCQSLGRLPVPNPALGHAWEMVPKKSEVKPSDLFSSPLCYTTGTLNKHEQTTFHDVAWRSAWFVVIFLQGHPRVCPLCGQHLLEQRINMYSIKSLIRAISPSSLQPRSHPLLRLPTAIPQTAIPLSSWR